MSWIIKAGKEDYLFRLEITSSPQRIPRVETMAHLSLSPSHVMRFTSHDEVAALCSFLAFTESNGAEYVPVEVPV